MPRPSGPSAGGSELCRLQTEASASRRLTSVMLKFHPYDSTMNVFPQKIRQQYSDTRGTASFAVGDRIRVEFLVRALIRCGHLRVLCNNLCYLNHELVRIYKADKDAIPLPVNEVPARASSTR